jgi:hypothetical protein
MTDDPSWEERLARMDALLLRNTQLATEVILLFELLEGFQNQTLDHLQDHEADPDAHTGD